MDVIFEDPPGTLVTMWLDAAIVESHESTSEPTDYPVGTTRTGTDHSKKNPDTLSIEGVVTNTPLAQPQSHMDGVTSSVGQSGKATVLQFSGEFDRVRNIDRQIRRIQDQRIFCTVITTLRTYENMLIRRYAAKKDAASAKSLPFTIDFRQILVANSQTTTVPDPLEPRGAAARTRGTQAAEDQTPERRSVLQALISS